jgi:hypothetical protein
MTSGAGRGLALALAMLAVAAAPASAATYRGTAVGDPAMPVKIKLTGDVVIFDYTNVLTECSNGSETRQGGFEHSDRLSGRDRFKDRLELDEPKPGIERATSVVKGKVGKRKAAGTLTYDLVYHGGMCHSGVVEWKAKRK